MQGRERDLSAAPVAPETAGGVTPALWHVRAPRHWDAPFAWWMKLLVLGVLGVVAYFFVDQPVAAWVLEKPRIPDMGYSNAAMSEEELKRVRGGDIGRELMMLEQYGQWVFSVLAVWAVAVLDKEGRRKALAIGLACLVTVLLCYALKDVFGRSRPGVMGPDGSWVFKGPWFGFTNSSSKWEAFPSAHTTGAFALSAGLAWFYPRGRGLFYLLAVMTAAMRVLHGAHYVSDVLLGVVLSLGTVRAVLGLNLAGRWIALMPRVFREWYLGDWAEVGRG